MKGIQNTSTNNFSAIIGNNKKFIVPKFQRDYSWDMEQWDDLWMDIESMLENEEDHYMGYLVLQTNDDKLFQIIDGQQRFTTITLLILAAIKCIKELVNKGIDEEYNKKRVDNLINTYIGKEDAVTLQYDNLLVLNRNNNGYYCDYIVKMTDLRVRNLKTSEKLLKKCFEFYEQKLKSKFNSGKDYASYIQKIVENLYFTQIVVSDDLNAFRVFETLNARGVQLSSSDLLKNYLFSLVDRDSNHSSHIVILEDKWAKLTDNIRSEKLPEFLRYYWNTKHKSIRANAVFKTIRKEVKTNKDVFLLVDELFRYSDVYMALLNPNDEMWIDNEVKHNIALLNLFRLKQPLSVLMAAKINTDDVTFKKILKRIITVCFRYNVICDRNPNDQETPFNTFAIKLSTEKTVDFSLLSSIEVADSEFENSFRDKSFPYNSRNAKIIRYILAKIEKFEGSAQDVDFNDEDASVEHIMPQNASDAWSIPEEKVQKFVFRLGNTCLLERSLNKTLKDDDYKSKEPSYTRSSYLAAQGLHKKYLDWTESSIISRQKDMAHKAITIWRLS